MSKDRYYHVLRGGRGQAAKNKLIAHFQGLTENPAPTGTPKNRPESHKGAVTPFGFNLGDGTKLEASYVGESVGGIITAVGSTRFTTTIPANTTVLKLPKIKAARVSASTGVAAQGTYKTSKVTGLHYLAYGGTAHSVPFGKGAPTETLESAFVIIRNALIAAGTYKNIHLIKEVF